MRFTVVWAKDAEGELAEIWMQASDRLAVNAAATALDAELAVDPGTKGFPLSEGLRRLTVPPLHAFFEVHEDDRLVRVTGIVRSR